MALHSTRRRARFGHVSLIAAGVGAIALMISACSGSSSSSKTTSSASGASVPSASSGASTSSGAGSAGDDGAKLTMWVRSSTDAFSKRLVDDYNSTHKNKVSLTIIPDANYLQKVGAAAGSKSLPDLLASDVVYSPNYVKQGLYRDITAELKALPHFNDLVQAHLKAASKDGKIYAVPHKVDSSLIFYNKDLFTKAGLKATTGPKNYTDIYNDAKAVRALGGDTYGFYFAGNCPGCNAYTAFPYGAADGHPPVSADGTKADINSDALNQAFALYKRMFHDGLVASKAKTEDGSTWTASFLAGKVGILPAGSFLFGDLAAKAKFAWGVAPLTNPDGSKSATFVGGDVLGISSSSKKEKESFDFVSWTLGDHAQVEDIAKNGDLPARVDLAGNKYTVKDPRVSATVKGLANGYTPLALPYGALINDANGPWLAGVRGAIFGTGGANPLATAQTKIQAGLRAG